MPDDTGDILDHPRPLWLSDHLWSATRPGMVRSAELTPLYIERYRGPWDQARPQRHSYWEFIHVWRGEARMEIEGRRRPFPAGATALLPPGRLHVERPGPVGMEVLWMGVAGGLLDGLPRDGSLVLRDHHSRPHWNLLWECYARLAPLSGPELDGLAKTLAARFLRGSTAWRQWDVDGLEEAETYLEQQCVSNEPVAAIAARFGMSVSNFHLRFRRRTGLTPNAYRLRARMRAAYRMLRHRSMPVKEVARLAGYDDPLYFSRVFRKTFGHSPARLMAGARSESPPDAE